MNFNIKESTKRKNGGKQQSALSFGLNTRKNKASSSILQDESSSSSSSSEKEEESGDISRKNVNREIAAEQAALRKRAEKAISEMSTINNIHDYDAEYESFSSDRQQKIKKIQEEKKKMNLPKESRYISHLMEKAKERKQEREIILERKIAREQEAEGLDDEYLGKDKFVTKAYKRVLEERENWLEKEKKQSKIEEEEDVTKRKGTGVMGLYNNFDAIIGNGENRKGVNTKPNNEGSGQENLDKAYNFNENGFRAGKSKEGDDDHSYVDAESVDGMDEELKEQASRAERLHKIFSARDRYLDRLRATSMETVTVAVSDNGFS